MAVTCALCGRVEKDAHPNSKRCRPCRKKFGPCIPTFTAEQIRIIRASQGRLYRHEIASKIGVSTATLTRWAKAHGMRLNARDYDKETVRRVCSYYALHGSVATAKKFPDVKVRSIVDRFDHAPRQIRWRNGEIVMLVRMAGLVGPDAAAAYFDRPGAHAGSIKAFFQKRFRMGGGCLNGWYPHKTKEICRDSLPIHDLPWWTSRRRPKTGTGSPRTHRRIALWVDIEAHLRRDVDPEIRQLVSIMASFQRWLHGKRVRDSVRRIINGVSRAHEQRQR